MNTVSSKFSCLTLENRDLWERMLKLQEIRIRLHFTKSIFMLKVLRFTESNKEGIIIF